MSRTKDITIACLAVATAGLAIVAWRERAEHRRLVRFFESAVRASDATVTVHNATKRRVPIAQRPSAPPATRGQPETVETAELSGVPPSFESPATSRPRKGSALVRLMDNPEFVQALGLQRRAMLDSRFADLFRRLNLEGDELARFKHLLAEKENVALDVVVVNETSPEGPLSNDALRTSIRAAQAQVEQAIHSSLGSERYAIYREFEQTLAQRATVAQLEQRLSYTAAPLTPAQSEAVVRILVATAPPAAVDSIPALSVVVRAGVPEAVPMLPTSAATGRVTEEAVVQAQTVLTPSQVTALREIQVEQQAAVQTAQVIRETGIVNEIPGLGLLLLQ